MTFTSRTTNKILEDIKYLSNWLRSERKDLWILVKELPTSALSLASWSKGLVGVAWTIQTTKYQPISRRGINAHRRPPTRAFTREKSEGSTEECSLEGLVNEPGFQNPLKWLEQNCIAEGSIPPGEQKEFVWAGPKHLDSKQAPSFITFF